jgi:hypothetical protein
LLFEISIHYNTGGTLQILSSALHRPRLTIPAINRYFQRHLETDDLLAISESRGTPWRIPVNGTVAVIFTGLENAALHGVF